MAEEHGRTRRRKVAKLLDEYDFDGLGAELERRWNDDGVEGMSLRDLEEYFNQRLLEHRMRSVGMQSLEGEVSNLYRLLTDDDVSPGERTRVKRRLARAGVDVESLRNDFVSYQSIRNYLREHRGASYEADEGQPHESAKRLVDQMQKRTSTIAQNKLEQLSNHEDFHLPDPQVYADVYAICGDCSTQHRVSELIDNGGCDCER